MINRFAMPARILRLTILSVFGLAISYAMGITSMGTLIVYCGLLHMYSESLLGCRALLGKRVLLQFVGVPITQTIHYLLFLALPGIPVSLRLCIGVAVSLPTLLILNYKLKLDFSEVSLHVIVALITITFETNLIYFIWRLILTTLGTVISYLTYKYVFPLNNDRVYEDTWHDLLSALESLMADIAVPQQRSGYSSLEITTCRALAEQSGKHLNVVCQDVDIKRQYASYRGRTDLLSHEHKVAVLFLDLWEVIEKEREAISTRHLALCAEAATKYWRRFREADEEGRICDGSPECAHEWDKSLLGTIETPADFRLSSCLERLRESLHYEDFQVAEKSA